ncbi:hypothetical protein AA313_de0205371 [Arthrobotrys entomopaga]|nr:hypothetical protein AA313_de0205371 [Arthrobotrys entomopaga]
MKSTLLSSALVTFGTLLSFANAGYYGAAPAPAPACSTATHQTCATAYGANKPYGIVPTNVKTVSNTKLVTSTSWKPAATHTVTGKDSTVTKQVTTTCTVKKQCAVKTIYVTHVTTSTKTINSVYTSTKDVTVKKTGAAYTVPTPYGFVNVADDSYNKEHMKRDYGYYNNAPQSYPTAVQCTKTLGATCTTTITKQSPTVTRTVPGKTKTVTHTNSVYVTVCANPTVKTVTTVSTRVVSTTKKSTVNVTKTHTSTIAGPTTYAACSSHNLYSGSNGVSVTGAKGDILVAGINSAYDCCVACQKHQTYGKSDCAGSYFTASDSYSGNKCYLRITNTCPSQSSCTQLFKKSSSYGSKTTVSNGACGRWHCSA